MSEIFEPKPRFKGCPPICLATNLPAFDTRAHARAFHQANGPACHVENDRLCKACGKWHYDSIAPSPGGESSGMSRYHKHKNKMKGHK